MFINTSHGAHHGEAFVRSVKHGVEYHVYGTGTDREVVVHDHRDDDARS